MRLHVPFRKVLLVLCSTVLLGISCPPILKDSIKTGVTSWVTGNVNSLDASALGDILLNGFTGGLGFDDLL